MTKIELRKLQERTGHFLQLDDLPAIFKLNTLAHDCDERDGGMERLLDLRVRVSDKVSLGRITFGACEWLREMLDIDDTPDNRVYSNMVLVWLLAQDDQQKAIQGVADEHDLRKQVRAFFRSLDCSSHALEGALKQVWTPPSEDDDGSTKEDQSSLLAFLEREYGHTVEYWLWHISIDHIKLLVDDYIRRNEKEAESVRKQMSKSGKHGSAQFFPERKLKALRKFREQLQAIEKIWQSET
jgi:hypothetical protein